MPIEVRHGMNLSQLLTMLTALQAQGATEVQFLSLDREGNGIQRGADWLAPHPVQGVAYVALMSDSEPASNEAMLAAEL